MFSVFFAKEDPRSTVCTSFRRPTLTQVSAPFLAVCCKPRVLYGLQVHLFLPSISSRSAQASTLSSTFDLFFSIGKISYISLRLSRSIRGHALHAIYLFFSFLSPFALTSTNPQHNYSHNQSVLGQAQQSLHMSPTPTTHHKFIASIAPGHPSYASFSWTKVPSVMSKDHTIYYYTLKDSKEYKHKHKPNIFAPSDIAHQHLTWQSTVYIVQLYPTMITGGFGDIDHMSYRALDVTADTMAYHATGTYMLAAHPAALLGGVPLFSGHVNSPHFQTFVVSHTASHRGIAPPLHEIRHPEDAASSRNCGRDEFCESCSPPFKELAIRDT